MTRLAVCVEGQTEEEFVKQVLSGHLRAGAVEATPILLGRARGSGSGGNVSADRLAKEMVHLCHSFDAVTSLVDYYGFRGKKDKTVEDLEEDLSIRIEARVRGRCAVFPYVQRHEFEGLLFSDVGVFGEMAVFPDASVAALRAVRSRFQSPEDINDCVRTAPSRRSSEVIPNFNKVLYGPLLAGKIGLARIRADMRPLRCLGGAPGIAGIRMMPAGSSPRTRESPRALCRRRA